MTHAHAGDGLGAAAWRGTRWGVLGVTRPAREAQESGHPIAVANARNAVNHAWTFVTSIVVVAVAVPLVVTLVNAVAGLAAPASWMISFPVLGGMLGLAINSLVHASRGARAAERGEVYRVPQTIPFTR